jgi:hypothetical protein
VNLRTSGSPTHAEKDVMYVIDSTNNTLGTLNRTTGAVTTVGSTLGNLLGLVCLPD